MPFKNFFISIYKNSRGQNGHPNKRRNNPSPPWEQSTQAAEKPKDKPLRATTIHQQRKKQIFCFIHLQEA